MDGERRIVIEFLSWGCTAEFSPSKGWQSSDKMLQLLLETTSNPYNPASSMLWVTQGDLFKWLADAVQRKFPDARVVRIDPPADIKVVSVEGRKRKADEDDQRER